MRCWKDKNRKVQGKREVKSVHDERYMGFLDDVNWTGNIADNSLIVRVGTSWTFSSNGCDGEMLLHRLDLKGICVSTGSACDSKRTQVSHVLQAINLVSDYAMGTIRVSLGRLNTIDDAVTIADAIISIIG